MASGYKDFAATAPHTLRFAWEEKEQSVANNYTVVAWSLLLIADKYGYISSSTNRDWAVNVNGEEYSGKNAVSIGNNQTKTLASGETTITHNADGSKTFSYYFTQYFNITFSEKWVGAVSGEGTGTLTGIPRAAQLTAATNITDEYGYATINFNNPAGNAVSRLELCIGDLNWQTLTPYKTITNKTATSYEYPLDESDVFQGTTW